MLLLMQLTKPCEHLTIGLHCPGINSNPQPLIIPLGIFAGAMEEIAPVVTASNLNEYYSNLFLARVKTLVTAKFII